MRKWMLYSAVLVWLLSSCASVPVVPTQPSRPVELAPLSQPAPAIDWQQKMQDFLSGMLPELPF